jgi:hypothetical protein
MKYPKLWILCLLLGTPLSQVWADDLTVFNIRPTRYLDTTSPRSLAFSMAAQGRSKTLFPIGHTNIRLRCTNEAGEVQEIWTGKTSDDPDDMVKQVLKQKSGFGFIFTDFPGHIETKEEILQNLSLLRRNLLVNSVRYEIDSETCERLVQFYHHYNTLPAAKNYSFVSNPLNNEGSICSTYVYAFLKLANIQTFVEPETWTRKLNIPTELIGQPAKSRTVPLVKMLVGRFSSRWAKQDEEQIQTGIMDPAFMWRTINNAYADISHRRKMKLDANEQNPVRIDQEMQETFGYRGLYVDTRETIQENP